MCGTLCRCGLRSFLGGRSFGTVCSRVATTARGARCAGRLGHMQAAAGIDLDAAHFVPGAQLGERNAEAIGDGDQRIAPARGVKQHVRGRRGNRSERDGERFDALQAGCGAQFVGVGEFTFRDVELVSGCRLR